jgi:hypothetical protein
VNIFILETAINTYVGEDGKHKVFASETDLLYPPDWKRFVDYLEVSIRAAIRYLGDLCGVLNEAIDHPIPDELDLELWIKAGKNPFCFPQKVDITNSRVNLLNKSCRLAIFPLLTDFHALTAR